MTAADEQLVAELAEVLPPHQTWCHGEAHAECCGAGDCDCGISDALHRLLPVVLADRRRAVAAALREAADWLRPHVPIEVSVAAFLHARADAVETGDGR
jgi:hypothetical protein